MAQVLIPPPPETKDKNLDRWLNNLTSILRSYSSTWVPETNTDLYDMGDPGAATFVTADFTCDNAWHDLNLSAIVPAGTKAVFMRVLITDLSIGNFLRFRKNGNSNAITSPAARTQVANVTFEAPSILVFCDTNRVIEYLGNSAFDDIVVVITGWIL